MELDPSKQLDPTQLSAVEHVGSPLLVTAGPGSGKTGVILGRIKFFLKENIEPSEILCLTFSEKAAKDVRERLEDDPEIKAFRQMDAVGVAQVRIIPATGAEKFAEYIYNKLNEFVKTETDNRVRVIKVKFMEHGKNAAYYCE